MTTRSALAVLARVVRLSPPPWRRLAYATALGTGAAAATVASLAGAGALVDRAALQPGLASIAGLLAIVEVLAVIRAPLRYGERLVAHDGAFRALSRWRSWLYDCLEPLSPAGLGALRSGDLLSRAIEDVDTLQDLYLRQLGPLVVAMTVAALAVIVEGVLLPAAALVIGIALVVALTVAPAVALLGSAAEGRARQLRGRIAADVVDLLQGASDLVAFGRAADYQARIAEADAELARLGRRRSTAGAAATAIVALCLGGAVVGVLAVAVAAVRAHQLEGIMLAVLPLAAIGAFEAVAPVAAAAFRAGDVVSAGQRLLALESVPAPVTDPAVPAQIPGGCLGVTFTDARLRYRDDLPWALDGLTLAAAPGCRTAVVGPSGAGKSSVVNALLRFWPLSSGEASLGGTPVEHLRQEDVRRTVGWLAQDAPLFAGTIRRNLTLGRNDVDEQELTEAVRLAQLDSWVASLPDGLDTPVGDRGAQVSGGQRQRIALARTLLAGSPVLVLDEPTAGLDEPTADRLLADVLAAYRGRTVLLVTHRHRELAAFDQVAELHRGRVAALTGGPVGEPGGSPSPGGPPAAAAAQTFTRDIKSSG